MSNGEDHNCGKRCPNDSIANMITALKSTRKRCLSPNSSIDEEINSPLKRVKEMDGTYIGSPREIRRIRADLVHARNTVSSLENRIRQSHTIRKEMEILFESEIKGLNHQHERDTKSIEDLETQLQSIRKREIELKNELSEVNNKHRTLKIEMDAKIEELEKKFCDISSDKKIHDEQESTTISHLKRKVSELEFLYQAAQDDAKAHKDLALELDKRLSQQKTIDRDMEQKEQALQKAQLYIKELEYEKDTLKEVQEQARTQQHKLTTYGDLEKDCLKLRDEVRKLKDEVYNKLLLEEEVYDLRARLLKFQEQDKKLQALMVTQVQTEMYLDEWRAVARGICESSASDGSLPRLLRGAVERLQQQEINLMSDKVQLESQVTSALHDANVAKEELCKNQKHMTEMQATIKQSQNLIHRMKKKLLLVSRERDSYRLQLDSYERDLTVCINPASSAHPGATQLQTQRERIEELEKIVEGYRDVVNKLENDLEHFEPLPHTAVLPVHAEQLSRLQADLDKLKNDNELLRNRKDELEIKLEELLVGKDEELGQVVHPKSNPFNDLVTERENELAKLQQEVIKLRRKVKNYEEGLEASKLGDVSICPKDIQSLKEQIKNAEIHTQRLKDFFKSSMQEFRNVVYMLLGYKIDKAGNTQYKLTSMYAEKAEDNLCFQLHKDGTLNLMQNEFSMSLEDMVQLHLRRQKSIPLFLSSITMDLFNNRTMGKEDDDEEELEEEEEVEENIDDSD